MLNRRRIFKSETATEIELVGIVNKLSEELKAPDVLFLKGEVSAGKTTLIRHYCESFGFNLVQSPTYAIHNRYQNKKIKIDHLDLYRIENEEQLETVGLWDLFQEPDNLILIEWADRLREQNYPLDRAIYELQINILDESRRGYELFKIT